MLLWYPESVRGSTEHPPSVGNLEMKAVKILDCGHVPSEVTHCGTGYATYEGKTVCYDCATILDRAEMVLADKMLGYLSMAGHAITNWPGGVLVDCTEMWPMRHNFYPYRLIHWRGKDSEGREWYGKASGRGMATVMHRAKKKRI
jgi:hypothetical protein